jgi:Domain of unknown function (DUF4252)
MTKTIKALQVVLVVAMVGGPLAVAQEIVITPRVKVTPVADVAGVDLHIAGLNMQTKITMNVGYQTKDDFFAGAEKFAQGATEATEINLDPSTMGLVGMNHGRDGEEARKMKAMSIHTYKYDKPGMYRMEDVDAYRKKLDGGNWHCAIHVRTTTGSTDICSRTGSDKETNEMVILTAEPQKLTFIHMSGKMSLDELNDMSGSAAHFRPRTGLPSPPMEPRVPREPMAPKPPKMKMKGESPVPPAAPAPPAPAAAPAGSPI